MTTKKDSESDANKSDGNQTSTDKPVQGGLGSKSVTDVPEGEPTGADSPHAS